MKLIEPFSDLNHALDSLDNGGRFYNFSSKANDGNITSAELAKAAGVFTDKQKMMLYLEMSLLALSEKEKFSIWQRFSEDLMESFQKNAPLQFLPSEASILAKVSSMAIVTGIPKWVDSEDKLTGFITVPVSTGKITTLIMIPIFEKYDVYELRDQDTDEHFLIAQSKDAVKLPEQRIHCGGIIRELKNKKDKNAESTIFLETIYYSQVLES
ncbi:hypothetical protein N6H18_05485 [Reichenbachiella agarivorans]|uniref:Uncharacterized protein n=1 Tax=Reichenbachiella agarivorans TaxID=2979464 RepID=A0ABY6CVH7_9BACT|nr:hypothetical protein [Reichenbachiella agarivorans]UXP33403.1 hypothetical protein N6H18_05485 [Reichenbachiella agarivorans]